MIIEQAIYDKILQSIKPAPPETGGIIGEKRGIVSYYVYDKGLPSKNIGIYYPDIKLLNQVLKEWADKNIKFCGIIHSHLKQQCELSNGDVEYILKILSHMPQEYKELYFPLVIEKEFIVYKAQMTVNGITIIRDIVKIVQGR